MQFIAEYTERMIFQQFQCLSVECVTNRNVSVEHPLQNKSTTVFLQTESIHLFLKEFYCEIFAGVEDASFILLSAGNYLSTQDYFYTRKYCSYTRNLIG